MKKFRKGFTLVELLIVILIIGILAANVSLINKKATSSAKVSTIVNNLNTLKTAGMLYYMDHMYSKDTEMTTDSLMKTSPDYLGDAAKGMIAYGYGVATVTNQPKKWYVYYNLNHDTVKSDPDITDIKSKLAAQASTSGLLGDTAAPGTKAITAVYTNQNYVLLQVR